MSVARIAALRLVSALAALGILATTSLTVMEACGGGDSENGAAQTGSDAMAAADQGATPPGDATVLPGHDGDVDAAEAGPDGEACALGSCSAESPWTDAAAYVATPGPTSRSAAHGGDPNPAGRFCMSCHSPIGPGRRLQFGGTARKQVTVIVDAGPGAEAGTKTVIVPAAGAEIQLRDFAGRVVSVYADDDGNFFALSASVPSCFDFPARAGARADAGTRAMTSCPTHGNCNGCHGPGILIQ